MMSSLKEAIFYLSDLIEKVLKETFNNADFSDLTQQQLHYLQVIVRMKNPTLGELANELGISKPTVTVLVDRLAERGYIRRIPCTNDKRVMRLAIDSKGTKIYELRQIASQKMAKRIRAGLSETETAILTELLKKIVSQN